MQVLCYTQLVRSCYTYNHLIHWAAIAAVVSSRQSLEQKQRAALVEEQEEQEKMELEQEQNRERRRGRSRIGERGHN